MPDEPSLMENSTGASVKKKSSTPNDFIFGKTLGEGSYSTVFRAKEVGTDNEFAIKVLEKRHIARERKVEYVHREKDVFAMIQKHPLFVNLNRTFQDEERLYFVLSYAKRGELLDYLKKEGCFSIPCTKFYAAELVVALQLLRKLGIIHRDLKPENILLNEDMHIQITDFGSAKIIGKSSSASANPVNPTGKRRNSFVGTAQYVSPEILNSKTSYYSSDLWALGCVIYQMLTGKHAFHGGNEYMIFQKILGLDYEFPAGFDPEARTLVEQLLVLNPEERLGSDETGGFEALKAHPFFEGVVWEDIHKQKPPELGPFLPSTNSNNDLLEGVPGFPPPIEACLPGELDEENIKLISEQEKMSKLKEQAEKNKYHRFTEGNLILKQGVMVKRKGFSFKRRMFLLTEGPNLYYVDPNNMVLKGKIPWSSELRPEAKNFKVFLIHTPNRTYYLEEQQGNSLTWCKELDKLYVQTYGERQNQNAKS